MTLAYMPGCMLEGSAREYDAATRAVFDALGVELTDVPGWRCCGGTTLRSLDPESWIERNAANLERAAADAAAAPEPRQTREVYFNGGFTPAPVFHRADLRPGHRLAGPAVIEQMDSTTLIHPGQQAEVDAYHNIFITL